VQIFTVLTKISERLAQEAAQRGLGDAFQAQSGEYAQY
jgi:hypothetical protein